MKKKHEILRRYFREYLLTRCKYPKQEKFRLAVVDGFSGAGLYECGNFGSPLIFIDGLLKAAIEINTERENQDLKPILIECLLVFNDRDPKVIGQLKQNIAPLLLQVEAFEHLQIETNFHSSIFETVYPQIKQRLLAARCRNVFFNLDQCGYSHVTSDIIRNIVSSWNSAEILLTFLIESLLTFLSPNNNTNGVPLEPEMSNKINELLRDKEQLIGKKRMAGRSRNDCFFHSKKLLYLR
ncbi:MAG: three-Cys-motif partner protein TcmP [Candidatus Thiodiazotropha sp. L084R]